MVRGMFPYLRYHSAKQNVDQVSKTIFHLDWVRLVFDKKLLASLILAFAPKTIVA